MALFPLFIDLQGKKALVVGAGSVAARKIKTLLAFKPDITVIAKSVKSAEISRWAEEGKLKLFEREFKPEDVANFDLVVVAVDEIETQKKAFYECTKRGIPVNCVDVPEYCSFIFPSVIIRGELVIAITTSGRAPSVSKKLRETLEQILPVDIEKRIEEIHRIRENNNIEKNHKLNLISELTESIFKE